VRSAKAFGRAMTVMASTVIISFQQRAALIISAFGNDIVNHIVEEMARII
jgi:hypothetical protein